MSEYTESMIVEFARRKKQMFYNLGFSLALLAIGVSMLSLSDKLTQLLGSAGTWSHLGLTQFICSIVFVVLGLQQYRCPHCGHQMQTYHKFCLKSSGEEGEASCPHCGTRLI